MENPELANYPRNNPVASDVNGNVDISSGIIDFLFPSEIRGEAVETIGPSAFRGLACFSSVTIPESVTTIGEYAFAECPNLSFIILEGRVDYEGMTVGEHWAGDAVVLFGEVMVEQIPEEGIEEEEQDPIQDSITDSSILAPETLTGDAIQTPEQEEVTTGDAINDEQDSTTSSAIEPPDALIPESKEETDPEQSPPVDPIDPPPPEDEGDSEDEPETPAEEQGDDPDPPVVTDPKKEENKEEPVETPVDPEDSTEMDPVTTPPAAEPGKEGEEDPVPGDSGVEEPSAPQEPVIEDVPENETPAEEASDPAEEVVEEDPVSETVPETTPETIE